MSNRDFANHAHRAETLTIKPPGLKAWLVVFSAALFFFYEFIQLNIFNAINTQLRAEFNMSATQISFISSMSLVANLLLLLPAGLILDRVSIRKVIMSALLIVIIGTFGFAFSSSIFQLGFFHFLAGLGNAFCFLSCVLLVVRWFPQRLQATVVGLVVTIAFAGGVVAQWPITKLLEVFTWREVLLLDATLGVLIFSLIWWQVRDYPDGHGEMTQAKTLSGLSFAQSLLRAVRNVQNILVGLYTSLLNLPIMVMASIWGIPFLMEVHGLTGEQAAFVSSMIFIGSIFGCPMAGWISDTLQRRKLPMVVGAILSLIASILLIYLPDQNLVVLMSLFFALGFFTSTQVITYPMIAENNPKAISGVAMAVASVIIMSGAAVARNLFGILMDLNAQQTSFDVQPVYSSDTYLIAMHMYPIAMFMGLIAILLCRETMGQSKSNAN